MITRRFFKLLALSLILPLFSLKSFAQVPAPADHFGFAPGSDGMLFNYEELIGYLDILDEGSPMLKMVNIGNSPMGKPMYIAFISSADNIARLDELKEINRELALNPALSEEQREEMLSRGRVFFLATLSMHSGEVGPSQAAPDIAYHLLTSKEEDVAKWMDEVVYMMVPNHNPDGMNMIVDHYNKYKGTKYEGSSLPGVYHKYIGHDNNRDFVSLSQEDTRAIAAIYNLDWYPQVMVEKHQMGSRGVRYFVPPPHDPIAENVDAGIWNWISIFGSNMITDMTAQGLQGIAQHYLFDDYWPGSTETCLWKNVIGMLTEAASVQTATPIFIEPNELSVWGKGLSEYEKSINMPELWPGGWWHLSDILDYEKASTYSILKTSSLHRKAILKFRNDLCRAEVEKGSTEAPFHYILPRKQHDEGEFVRLVNLMLEHGVQVYALSEQINTDAGHFKEGDIVIPLAQAFRPFIKEVMEAQVFPLRHYTPNGKIIRPYDITSWSLPLHNGVSSVEIDFQVPGIYDKLTAVTAPYDLKEGLMTETWGLGFPVEHNESFKAAFMAIGLGLPVSRTLEDAELNGKTLKKGSFIVSGTAKRAAHEELYRSLTTDPVHLHAEPGVASVSLKMPRIALVETYMHDMDAGWTRFVFDSYELPYTVVRPGDFEDADLRKDYDVVIFPGANKDILKDGKYKSDKGYYMSSYPPEFVKGMGTKGMDRLMNYLDQGGLIVSWGRSTELFVGALKIKHGEEDIEEFQLPVADISSSLKEVYCPGSFVKMELKEDHLLTLGMPTETGVFYRGKPVFTTSVPRFDMDRRVIGKFPEKDILLSGYIEKEEKLSDKTAMVWLKKGKGQLVLFAFHPQFRASTAASYKLLFNAILLPAVDR